MARLLIVDDDPTLVNLLKETLQAEGHSVDTAYDGNSALEKISQQSPDALVVDVNMPGISGLEVTKTLRSQPATRHLPILLLTGEAAKDVISIDNDPRLSCLEKPVDLDTLTARLRQILQ